MTYQQRYGILVAAVASFKGASPVGLRLMLTSAKRHGIEVTLLGHERPWGGFFDSKIIGVGQDLYRMRDDYAMAILVDAADVVFATDLEEIISRWGSSPPLFAAETRCYPDAHLADLYPVGGSRFRYLNSGGVIGGMEDLVEQYRQVGQMEGHDNDDQRAWTRHYLEGGEIAVDARCQVFQCLCGVADSILDGAGVNVETGGRPGIIHANGLSQSHLAYQRCC